MSDSAEHLSPAGRALLDRRRFLSHSATALGSIALTNLLGLDGLLAAIRGLSGRDDFADDFSMVELEFA